MIYYFQTEDHPQAGGRKPQAGEQQWTFKFKLVGGDELQVHLGRECHEAFRGFIMREEMDDAADTAMAQL